VDSLFLYANNGIVANVQKDYIPKWDGSGFVNSKIRETSTAAELILGSGNNNTSILIGGENGMAITIGYASSPMARISNLDEVRTTRLFATSNIISPLFQYDIIALINAVDYMPYNATLYTLTSKGYVDYRNSLLRDTMLNGAINGARIVDYTLTKQKFAQYSVDDWAIMPGSVSESKLSDNSVTTAKIVNYTILGQDIADNAVDSRIIKDKSILSTDIQDYTIGNLQMGDGSIAGRNIIDYSITQNHIANNAIRDRHLYVGEIKYRGNTLADNYMPQFPTDSTLTTLAYVEKKVAENRKITSNNADSAALVLNNSSSNNVNNNNLATALRIDTGRVILSYVDCDLTTHGWSLTDLNEYSVINITNGVDNSNAIVNMPETTDIALGQILYIINSTASTNIGIHNNANNGTSSWIYPGDAATFVCGKIHSSTDKTWYRIK
jgi:hypothetical protein